MCGDRQTIFLFGHKNPRIWVSNASVVQQFGDQRGPARLMRRAQALAGITVKILVEQVMSTKVGVGVEFFVVASGGDAALGIGAE